MGSMQNLWKPGYIHSNIVVCINKDEGNESLSLLGFEKNAINAIFINCFKENLVSSSYVEIQSISLDIFYDDINIYRCNLNTTVFRTHLNI